MTFQIVADMQPWQLAVDMSMKLGRDLFGLIEQAKRDIHLARQIVVTSGERRSAALAETTRDAGAHADLASFIWRERHVGAVEGGKRRDGCSGHPPAVGAVAVGDGAREGGRFNASLAAVASTGDLWRRGVIDHGELALNEVAFPREVGSGEASDVGDEWSISPFGRQRHVSNGGSEGGVLNLTTSARDDRNNSYCVSMTWNAERHLDETSLGELHASTFAALVGD